MPSFYRNFFVQTWGYHYNILAPRYRMFVQAAQKCQSINPDCIIPHIQSKNIRQKILSCLILKNYLETGTNGTSWEMPETWDPDPEIMSW